MQKLNFSLNISLCKTCYLQGGANFGPQRHNLNKLGRSSQDGATYIISGSMPSVQIRIFFYVFPKPM